MTEALAGHRFYVKLTPMVTVCTLVEGFYDAVVFQGQERIISSTFPQLNFNAEQVLAGHK